MMHTRFRYLFITQLDKITEQYVNRDVASKNPDCDYYENVRTTYKIVSILPFMTRQPSLRLADLQSELLQLLLGDKRRRTAHCIDGARRLGKSDDVADRGVAGEDHDVGIRAKSHA